MILYEYTIIGYSDKVHELNGRWLSDKISFFFSECDFIYSYVEDKVFTTEKLNNETLLFIKEECVNLLFVRIIDTTIEKTISKLIELITENLTDRNYQIAELLIETMKNIEKRNRK